MATMDELRKWVQAKPNRSVQIEIRSETNWRDKGTDVSEKVYLHDTDLHSCERFGSIEEIDIATIDSDISRKAIASAEADIRRAQHIIEAAKGVKQQHEHGTDEATDRTDGTAKEAGESGQSDEGRRTDAHGSDHSTV